MSFSSAVRCPAALGLVAVLGLACGPLAAQQLAWSGRAGMASDWLLRGVRLSDGGAPVLFGGVDLYAGGLGAGVGAMRLRSQEGGWSNVWSLRGGADWHLDARTALVVDLQHFRYGGTLATWDGNHLSIGLNLGDWGALYWNRQRLREPVLDADSLDAALRWPLAPQWRLAGGLGRAWHALGAPYVYGQVGTEWHPGALRVQLQRVWTHGVGRPLAGPAVAPRWVAAASWGF